MNVVVNQSFASPGQMGGGGRGVAGAADRAGCRCCRHTGSREFVQSVTGSGWKAAYFTAALGLQIGFVGAVGMLATFFVERVLPRGKRLLQIAIPPVVVVGWRS